MIQKSFLHLLYLYFLKKCLLIWSFTLLNKSPNSSIKPIENAYYDADLKAEDAVIKLYNSGIEISKIQKCFSIGMFGKNRKLVPTKWSITATDQIISNDLMHNILDFDIIDTYRVFNFDHLGNLFSVITVFYYILCREVENYPFDIYIISV